MPSTSRHIQDMDASLRWHDNSVVLDAFAGDLQPVVLARLPHREGRREGMGVVEHAERDGDGLGREVVDVK